jgi:FkbM family methyltransferase
MLRSALRRVMSSALKPLNLALVSQSGLNALNSRVEEAKYSTNDPDFLKALDPAVYALHALEKSTSQIGQDVFALSTLGLKRNGYFVEFGAADGVGLSNKHMMEKDYGWSGVLAEPCWREALQRNRACAIDTRCVWSRSHETLTFNEAKIGELSTIDAFSAGDQNRDLRISDARYEVETISLNDLLRQHQAPPVVDYLSIDTEGSEFDILSTLDFDRFQFRVVTCEHNFTPIREKIHALLSSHGYVRRLEAFSQWDDWYVKPGL